MGGSICLTGKHTETWSFGKPFAIISPLFVLQNHLSIYFNNLVGVRLNMIFICFKQGSMHFLCPKENPVLGFRPLVCVLVWCFPTTLAVSYCWFFLATLKFCWKTVKPKNLFIWHFQAINCCGATVGSQQQHNQDLRETYKGRRILEFITFYHIAFNQSALRHEQVK